MNIIEHFLTQNDCYKQGRIMVPAGIVVHSTGVNNKYLKRYIDMPELLGANQYNNHWNQAGVNKCVHAMIGLDKDGNLIVVQTLPWNYACWGCGRGAKGSYNDNYIQFEILEDGLRDEAYYREAVAKAVELCAYLTNQYPGIKNIVSHKEAHDLGYASNHGDPNHWMAVFGDSMNRFRAAVDSMGTSPGGADQEILPLSGKIKVIYKGADGLNVRTSPAMGDNIDQVVYGGTYTVTGISQDRQWYRLKSGVYITSGKQYVMYYEV